MKITKNMMVIYAAAVVGVLTITANAQWTVVNLHPAGATEMLIKHARRAKAHMSVRKLVKQAEKDLTSEEMRLVRRAADILDVAPSASSAAQPITSAEPREKAAATGSHTPYVLDREAFAAELAAAGAGDARLKVLARRWEAVKLAVGYCNAAHGGGPGEFHRSFTYWYSGWTRGPVSESKQDLDKPLQVDQDGVVIVRGDCLADITVESNAFIHIYGDLQSKIRIVDKVQCEIIIGGDIKPNGKIEDEGINTIFVGGNMDGDLENRGFTFIWINGDLNGTVETGTPSTSLHIMGEFAGSMKPWEEAALASLDVRGFMPTEKIKAIAKCGYTRFQASIGISDQPPGLHPEHEQHDSINRALAGPTGVSGGSALAIIPMLCNMELHKSTNLRNPTVKGTEKIQDVDCTIIEGQYLRGGLVRVWLDSSFGIRQIFTSHEIDPAKLPQPDGELADSKREKFVAETTITIKPTFDVAIDDKEFDFELPRDRQE